MFVCCKKVLSNKWYVLCLNSLIKENPTEAPGVAATSKTGTEQFVWLDEDQEGHPLPKRRRTGEKRKRCSATGLYFFSFLII